MASAENKLMENFKKESSTQNTQNGSEHTNSASDCQSTIYETTSQMKVSSKIEITITSKQLGEIKWLFGQYCQPPRLANTLSRSLRVAA